MSPGCGHISSQPNLSARYFGSFSKPLGYALDPLVRAVPIEEPPLFAVERWRIVGAKPIVDAKVAKECHELVYLRLVKRPPALF